MENCWDVFHVDGERGLRGGQRQLLYLAAALRAAGHRNTVVCRAGSPLQAQARRQGLAVETLPFLMEWDPVSAWRLARLAARARHPVLHAHTAHAAALACMAGAWTGVPWVAHRRVDFKTLNPLSRRLKYDRAGRVAAVSRAVAALLEAAGTPPGRIAVVPDGLPVDEEESGWAQMPADKFAAPSPSQRLALRRRFQDAYGVPETGIWVGNLAALVPHKDHDTLLAAAVLVLRGRPGLTFLIAGQGPEEARLLKSVERMGLAGRLFLLGQVREPESLLKCLDVFVLSSWGEGMGSALLEAAACGVPSAAASAGGIPEIVADRSSGLLAPPPRPRGPGRGHRPPGRRPGPGAPAGGPGAGGFAEFRAQTHGPPHGGRLCQPGLARY
ncbi:MAG: glycosyltransferase [Elusimicrobia bacterium]|nr:glycosyltransferase [Elusimicrobiota bacterium]